MKRIPSSGEELPAVGLGTWQTFDVGGDERPTIVLSDLHVPADGGAVSESLAKVLDDAAAVPIQAQLSGAAPFSGTFSPDQPLATLNGESANGTWNLKVQDFFLGDTGSVRDFSLILTACTGACPPATDPTVTITASGPTTICAGGSVTLTAPAAAS